MEPGTIKIARARYPDLPKIRNLQEKNHKDNLPLEKRQDGFISLRTNLPLLERIRNETGIVVAKNGVCLAGFELPLDQTHRFEARGGSDVMIPTLYSIEYRGKKIADYHWISGQYCVEECFRGMGIPSMMHPEFLNMLKGKFELLVFVIASLNARSLHVAIGKFGMVEVTDGFDRTWKTQVQEIK